MGEYYAISVLAKRHYKDYCLRAGVSSRQEKHRERNIMDVLRCGWRRCVLNVGLLLVALSLPQVLLA